MAKVVLCGIEKRPKLNGREVRLVAYHAKRGRWEVELCEEPPLDDVFKLEWNIKWNRSAEDVERDESRGEPPEKPLNEVLDEALARHNVTLDVLTIFGCNGERVFDPLVADRKEFPLSFEKEHDGGSTLAVRPCSLRLKEDDTVDKLRVQKVTMTASAVHRKPELDGQFGELGAFQATSYQWEVRPDVDSLWDVRVDGSREPTLLAAKEVCSEATGAQLCNAIQVAGWEPLEGQKAVYSSMCFKRGQIILEEEPIIGAPKATSVNMAIKAWRQYLKLPDEQRAAVLSMCKGEDCIRCLKTTANDNWQLGTQLLALGPEQVVQQSVEFKEMAQRARQECWDVMRVFDNNSFHHEEHAGRLLYATLSRINHSCTPNAVLVDSRPTIVANPNALRGPEHTPCRKALIALRDIAEGEEITISYISSYDLLEPAALRQKRLWGFKCICKRCSTEADAEESLRTFCCTAAESCGGRHIASGDCVLTCAGCGATASDPARLLREEGEFVDAYYSVVDEMALGAPLETPESLERILDGATQLGIAPEHWLVCKVRNELSSYYRKQGKLELAAEHAVPVLDLEERLTGDRSPVLVEALADDFSCLGQFVAAFKAYTTALQTLKRMSPGNRPGQSESCERVRRKLRATFEARKMRR